MSAEDDDSNMESEYDEDEDDSSSAGKTRAKRGGNKSKAGGVLHGQTKRSANANATAVGSNLKSKVSIKPGPVQDND